MNSKMMGKKGHGNYCDCNIEQYVSGKSEKCNYRYGVKRQRAKEKRILKRNIREGKE